MTKRRKDLAPVVTLVPKLRLRYRKLHLLELLEELGQRVDSEEITGVLVAVQVPTGYEFFRVGLTLVEAVGLADRQRDQLHRHWDERL